jgi:molybdopterin-guanine dinucleotide biosynthesis protein A
MIDCDAYILIGGRSSRLGHDKAVADLGGQSLAQRALDTLFAALPESRITFVAANEAQFAIEAVIAGGRFIFDLVPARGPLGGIHSALADTDAKWVFILACDYPFMTAEFIRFLADKVSDGHAAVVPEQPDGRLQPLCAFYKRAAAAPLIDAIIQRPRVPPPLHDIVNELDPVIVKSHEFAHFGSSDMFFVNINSRSDLDLAREIERKLSPGK